MPDGYQASGTIPSSQVPIVALASYSDDLFNPAIGGPSATSFNLPNVPFPKNSQFEQALPDTFDAGHFQYDTPPHMTMRPSYNPSCPPPIPPRPRDIISSYPIPVFNPLSIQFPRNPQTIITPPFPHVPIQNAPPPVITTAPPFVPNDPSVQYVYCLPTPSSTSLALPSFFSPHVTPKTLPSVTHISLLNSKSDIYARDEGVTALLCHLGLLGHILDSSAILDPSCPDRFPVLEPVLSASPNSLHLSNGGTMIMWLSMS